MSSAQSSRTRTSAPTESSPTNAPAASVGNAAEKPEHRAQEGAGAQRDGDGPGAPDPVADQPPPTLPNPLATIMPPTTRPGNTVESTAANAGAATRNASSQLRTPNSSQSCQE